MRFEQRDRVIEAADAASKFARAILHRRIVSGRQRLQRLVRPPQRRQRLALDDSGLSRSATASFALYNVASASL
jgi:hypothetical protein